MAQPASNPKIEELRFKVRTDPKSRLFYPLAEELRKVNQFGEAEQVLRTGLTNHPSYLSAWVGLGRVLREQKKDRDAVDAFAKGLQLDPGNVVAARLLAETYYAIGEKVEAIKKYKLVHALMPGDQEIEALIEGLERELKPITPSPFAMADEAPAAKPVMAAAPPMAAPPLAPPAAPAPAPSAEPTGPAPTVASEATPWNESGRVFDDTASSLLRAQMQQLASGDLEPMSAAHSESPFEEPSADLGYSSSAFDVEQPEGMHVTRAPFSADLPEGWADPLPVETAPPVAPATPLEMPPADEADVFAPAEATAATGATAAEEVTNTLTMADLYTRQGLHDEARRIYDAILERDPQNASVRSKRDALTPKKAAVAAEDPKVDKLQRWLKKVSRKEAGSV